MPILFRSGTGPGLERRFYRHRGAHHGAAQQGAFHAVPVVNHHLQFLHDDIGLFGVRKKFRHIGRDQASGKEAKGKGRQISAIQPRSLVTDQPPATAVAAVADQGLLLHTGQGVCRRAIVQAFAFVAGREGKVLEIAKFENEGIRTIFDTIHD